MQLLLTLLLLTQALLQLHRLRLLRPKQALELLSAAATSLLLFHPAARAASHFREAAAGELNGCFSTTTGFISLLAQLGVVGGLQLLTLLLQFGTMLLLLVTLLLQFTGLLLMTLGSALQLATSRLQLRQLPLHGNQLVLTKTFDGFLQHRQFLSSDFQLLLTLD